MVTVRGEDRVAPGFWTDKLRRVQRLIVAEDLLQVLQARIASRHGIFVLERTTENLLAACFAQVSACIDRVVAVVARLHLPTI